jgi:uncharacterized membrane protein
MSSSSPHSQPPHSGASHPRRAPIHENLTFGEKAAEQLAAFVGSWRFVIWQNVVVFAWIAFNLIGIYGLRWDPMPFILLNLVFSWQASNTGPILQLTSNRQAGKDRKRDDVEAKEVDMMSEMLRQNTQLTREVHEHILATQATPRLPQRDARGRFVTYRRG